MFFWHAPISLCKILIMFLLPVSCIRQTVTGCLQKRAWKYWSQEGGWVVIWGCADLQRVYCKCNEPICLLLAHDCPDKYMTAAWLFTCVIQPDSPAELGGKIYEMMTMALGGRWGRLETEEAEVTTSIDADSSEGATTEVVEPSEVRTESDLWKD